MSNQQNQLSIQPTEISSIPNQALPAAENTPKSLYLSLIKSTFIFFNQLLKTDKWVFYIPNTYQIFTQLCHKYVLETSEKTERWQWVLCWKEHHKKQFVAGPCSKDSTDLRRQKIKRMQRIDLPEMFQRNNKEIQVSLFHAIVSMTSECNLQKRKNSNAHCIRLGCQHESQGSAQLLSSPAAGQTHWDSAAVWQHHHNE